eukprot:scaffold1419_cov410-Prasinococcus_capsulatus_cf.AAC.5
MTGADASAWSNNSLVDAAPPRSPRGDARRGCALPRTVLQAGDQPDHRISDASCASASGPAPRRNFAGPSRRRVVADAESGREADPPCICYSRRPGCRDVCEPPSLPPPTANPVA